MSASVAFYCVADSRYYVGLVATLNSLRLHGHVEPLFVLDRGLTREQRARVAPHVELVQARDDLHPMLSKTFAPMQTPADVMVLLDVDVIVTRSFAPLLEHAQQRVVAFADRIDRFVPEWQTLAGSPHFHRRPYVNSGFVAFPNALGTQLLERIRELQEKVEFGTSRFGGGAPSDPFYFPDQDVWNAVLGTYVDDDVEILDNRLAPFPPFDGLELDNAREVTCRYTDGTRPYFLHYVLRKPWLASARRSVFTRLLTRLLFADDVAVRVTAAEVPLRLRPGRMGTTAALLSDLSARVASQRGRLGLRRSMSAWFDDRS